MRKKKRPQILDKLVLFFFKKNRSFLFVFVRIIGKQLNLPFSKNLSFWEKLISDSLLWY